jgi:hypothetical protein
MTATLTEPATSEDLTTALGNFRETLDQHRAKPQPAWRRPNRLPRVQFVTTKDLIAIGRATVGRDAVNIRVGAVGLMDNQLGTVSFRHRDICGPAFQKTYVFSKDEFMDAAGDRIEIEETT